MTQTSTNAAGQGVDGRAVLARFGLVAKGILYLFLGVLAVQFAGGDVRSKEVSETGAIQLVAEQPMGKFLLVVLSLGLVSLTLWHIVIAKEGDPAQGSETTDKIKYAAKAVAYGLLAISAIAITASNWGTTSGGGGGGGGGGSSEEQAADTLMGAPLGRYLVIGVGLAIVGFAVYELYQHAVKTEFMERFDVSGRTQRLVEGLGRVGYAARSIVAIITGIFFVVAGVQSNSDETRGLSGALRALAQQSWGPPLLWLVAVGFVLFGIFCFFEARYRRST